MANVIVSSAVHEKLHMTDGRGKPGRIGRELRLIDDLLLEGDAKKAVAKLVFAPK